MPQGSKKMARDKRALSRAFGMKRKSRANKDSHGEGEG